MRRPALLSIDNSSSARSPATALRVLLWPVEWLRGSARQSPLTLGFIAVFWVLGALTSTLRIGPVGALAAWTSLSAQSLPQHWPALLLSAFWATGPAGYLGGTVLALVVGLPCERLMGTGRFAAAAVGSQLAGGLLTIGFTHLTSALIGDWSRALVTESVVGPVPAFCGVAAAASTRLTTLWRRRVRIGLLTLLTMLALYGGSFSSLMTLGAALTGALGGPFLFGRRPVRVRDFITSRREARVLVGLAVIATALGPVISALAGHAVGPLAVLRYLSTNVEVTDAQSLDVLCSTGRATECAAAKLQLRAGLAGFFLAALPQVLLVVFADGLRRGRRFAWAGAVALQAMITVLAAVRAVRYLNGDALGFRYELVSAQSSLALLLPMAVPLAVLVLLVATRSLFTVSALPGTYRRLGLWVGGAAAVLSTTYMSGCLLVSSSFDPPASSQALLMDLPERFLPVPELANSVPSLFPHSVPAVLFYEGPGVLFWIFTCIALLSSFVQPAYSRQARDADRARHLLQAHGGSTMSWMTLWPGNTYWFSSSGNSYVAFRQNLGVALTVGEPVGPRSELRECVEEFNEFCIANGLAACFYSVSSDVERITGSMGFERLEVAEETVLPLGSLAFKGKRFQDVRTAMNHARKAGIEARWISYAHAPLALLDQLHAISEEWVADKKMPEMGFTLGGLDELDDPEVRCLIAVDADGTVHAVTSWLPVYRSGEVVGWTLDFMRRRSSGFRPSMDFLIASAAILLQDEGFTMLSLSGAPLARTSSGPREAAGPPLLENVLDLLGTTLEPVYGFRSLLAFKAKFQPEFIPLYMTYRDHASLPAIGNAVTRAYLPKVSLGQRMALMRRIVEGAR